MAVTRANNMILNQGRRGAYGARIPMQGRGVMGGGGAGGGGISSAFGPEGETVPGVMMGPFNLRDPQPTQRALEAQSKHAQFDQQAQGVMQAVQDEMAKGHGVGQALMNVFRSTPGALQIMHQGGQFKEMLDYMKATNEKSQYDPARGILVNKGTGEATDVTKGGQPIGPAPSGTISQGTDASGNPIFITQPGAGSRAAPGVHPAGAKPVLKPFQRTNPDGSTTTEYAPVDPTTGARMGQGSEKSTVAAKPAKPLTGPEENEVAGIERLMPALDRLNHAADAAGVFETPVMRGIARWTSTDSPQARELDKSLEAAHAAIGQAESSGGRLSKVYNDIQAQLPGNMSSEEDTREGINLVRDQMRNVVAAQLQSFKNTGKDTSRLDTLADTYNAQPEYMHQINQWRHQLLNDPNSLDNNAVMQLYAGEAFQPNGHFGLPRAEAQAVMGEVERRGLWGARDQILQSYNGQNGNRDLSYLPDRDTYMGKYAQSVQDHAKKWGPYQPPQQTQADQPGQPGGQPAPIAPGAPAQQPPATTNAGVQ